MRFVKSWLRRNRCLKPIFNHSIRLNYMCHSSNYFVGLWLIVEYLQWIAENCMLKKLRLCIILQIYIYIKITAVTEKLQTLDFVQSAKWGIHCSLQDVTRYRNSKQWSLPISCSCCYAVFLRQLKVSWFDHTADQFLGYVSRCEQDVNKGDARWMAFSEEPIRGLTFTRGHTPADLTWRHLGVAKS